MGRFVIELKIEKESDLYCRFNNHHELSEDVTKYITDKLSDRQKGESVLIQILCEEKIDEANVKKALDQWITSVDEKLKSDAKSDFVKQVWMFGVGIVFIALSLLVQSQVNTLTYTILSTIGAFAMWEAAAIWIVENPKRRVRRHIFDKLKQDVDVEIICK